MEDTNIATVSAEILVRKRKSWARELRERPGLQEIRIAVLGGSTTNEMVDFLELSLLEKGFRPVFYQSEYNKYFEDAVVDSAPLVAFRPDITYVYTSTVNLQQIPTFTAEEADLQACVNAEISRFASIWNALQEKTGSLVIQNNFEVSGYRILGNLDSVRPGGETRFVNALNNEFSRQAFARPRLFINDLNSVVATVGRKRFHDARRWFSYKLIATPEGNLEVARSVASVIGAIYGRSRKCLVLDLDNTLWGGVIGDDGPDKIKIGTETAEAEAYKAFQEYCLRLRERGIILAVASKNSDAIARLGFAHPDSVLKLEHISCFKANWEPKHESIKAIATELNIGLDSLVFVDDNPAERALVQAQLPMVAVPDVGSEVATFIDVLEQHRYFEPADISSEDLNRASQYSANARRAELQEQFANYGEYLDSLDMTAEIAAFRPVYLERITQLINKTNQFNLTTKRYTLAEIEKIAGDANSITLFGRLTDKFGDNGLISVVIGRCERDCLHVDLWLMSCRVLKREMEVAMLDALVAQCMERGIRFIRGYYLPTEKNAMVADHYAKMGFEAEPGEGKGSTWRMVLPSDYVPRTAHIRVKELIHG